MPRFTGSMPPDCHRNAPLDQEDVEHDGGQAALGHWSDHAGAAEFRGETLHPLQAALRIRALIREAPAGDRA